MGQCIAEQGQCQLAGALTGMRMPVEVGHDRIAVILQEQFL